MMMSLLKGVTEATGNNEGNSMGEDGLGALPPKWVN
jgi:hypothetical protein